MNITKKIWFLILWSLVLSLGFTSAYSAQTEQFIAWFEKELAKKKTAADKKAYLEQIESLMNDSTMKEKSELKTLNTEILEWIAKKLGKKTAQTQQSFRASTTPESIRIEWVDAQQLRDAWLWWHNSLRAEKGLEPLVYHSELERSATEWSKKQAETWYVGHKRKKTDWYYNYSSVQQRFADLGIKFASIGSGKSSFTESMWYRGYSCSGADCTSTMIDSTKKSFDAFVKEWPGGVHYKAIVMPHFKYVGVGFAVNSKTKTVYTTIHYGTDILE